VEEGEEFLTEANEGIESRANDGRRAANGNQEWTRTHGFFVIMGGFYLFDGEKPLRPLDRHEVADRVQNGLLIPPSEADIQDKSKGDGLSKGIVLVQVLWFITQCIARQIQHLPITLLEIITLAYSAVNVAIYGFWWYKPLNVMRPVRVAGQLSDGPVGMESNRRGVEWWMDVSENILGDAGNLSEMSQVPMFYSGNASSGQIRLALGVAFVMGEVFGAIHFLAWSFLFPSHTEQRSWRLSCIFLMTTLALPFLSSIIDKKTLTLLTNMPAYAVPRVAMLVLAFTTLRLLPEAALEIVHWTSFIPHI